MKARTAARFTLCMLMLLHFADAAYGMPAGDPSQPSRRTPGYRVNRYVDRIPAGGAEWYRLDVNAGESVHLVVAGNRNTNLDVYAYDASGNVVDFDDDETDYCITDWRATHAQTYRIKVVNLGPVYNEVEIIVTR